MSVAVVPLSSMGKSRRGSLKACSEFLIIRCSVYASKDRVSWPPSKIFGDEITIIGSFSETYMFRKSTRTLILIKRMNLTIWTPQPPQLTTSTRARSRPRVSSTRRLSWRTLARLSRASRTSLLSRPPLFLSNCVLEVQYTAGGNSDQDLTFCREGRARLEFFINKSKCGRD